MITLKYRRTDGSFVAEINGLPYHVIQGDELYWNNAVERAVVMGDNLPFEPPPPQLEPIPITSVSKAQAQMALYNAGLLDDLEAIIAAHPYRPVRIWYESANVWERAHPYVSMLAPELGLTDEQIDSLFLAASIL